MRARWMLLGAALVPLPVGVGACGDGGTNAPSLNAPVPGGSDTAPAPPAPSPMSDAGDAGPDGPTSNGGLARWSVGLGGAQTDVGFSVAGDAAGEVVASGSFQGTASFGGVPMTSAGGNDVFVAKYSPDGKAQWVRRFGGAGDEMVTSIGIAPSGYTWIAGASSGAIDFGGGPLGQGGAAGTFLVELDPFGNTVLAKAFGGGSYGTLVGVAVGSDGSVALCGAYQGQVDLGGGPLPAAQGMFDAFVAKFDASATLLFAQHLGGSGADLAQGVAVGPHGEVAVTGTFAATGDFGGGPVTSAGNNDAFATGFAAAGTVSWSKHFGGADNEDGRGVAYDVAGEVLLSGGFSDTIDFGAGPETSHGAVDAYVVKLNATSTVAWSRTFGGAGNDEAVAVAADSSGEALAGGLFEQTMTVGMTPFVSAGAHDIFALKLGTDGSNVWSKHFGAAEDDQGVGVAYDGYGRALVTGFFRAQVDFGSGVQSSAGDDDIFVAAFDP